jgi:hypothetical protein
MTNVHRMIDNYSGVQCAAMTASINCFVVVPSVETPNDTKLQSSVSLHSEVGYHNFVPTFSYWL